jgi:hypothetical protein
MIEELQHALNHLRRGEFGRVSVLRMLEIADAFAGRQSYWTALANEIATQVIQQERI